MLDRTDDSSVAADTWLAQFEEALGKPDEALLTTLFHPDSYWRDVLALSWNIQTLNGRDAILKALPPLAHRAGPSGFAIAPDRAAPRKVMRAGTHAIEAIFKFETNVGRGSGIIRLIPDADDGNRLKAWTLLTALQELKGFEEQLGVARPRSLAPDSGPDLPFHSALSAPSRMGIRFGKETPHRRQVMGNAHARQDGRQFGSRRQLACAVRGSARKAR